MKAGHPRGFNGRCARGDSAAASTQPLVFFAPETVGLTSIMLPLSTWLSQWPLKYVTKDLPGRAKRNGSQEKRWTEFFLGLKLV